MEDTSDVPDNLILNQRFHPRGGWLWAMRQVSLGYTVRRPNGITISPKINWSISAADAIAEDWDLA